jgi:hypothetical protein
LAVSRADPLNSSPNAWCQVPAGSHDPVALLVVLLELDVVVELDDDEPAAVRLLLDVVAVVVVVVLVDVVLEEVTEPVDVALDEVELDVFQDRWWAVPDRDEANELWGTAVTPAIAAAMPAAVTMGTRLLRRETMSSHRPLRRTA